MLKHILANTQNPMTVITLRRIAVSFPPPLQIELRELLRPQPLSMQKPAEQDEMLEEDFIAESTINELPVEKKPRKKSAPRKPKEESARSDVKTITRRKKKVEMDNSKVIYLHGLESTSQSGKARQFAALFPGMITPDFTGSFEERMEQLYPILGDKKDWTIIGSSYGGAMGGVFTCKHPDQVRKLILLAPALMLPEFINERFSKIDVPTVLIHGTQDDVVIPEPVRIIAEDIFTNLKYISVEDGHRLHKALEELDWAEILA